MEAKEILQKASNQIAELWVEQIQKPINKDNGDNNPMLFMLSTLNTQSAQSKLTAQKIEWFKVAINRVIKKEFDAGNTWITLSTDYGPDRLLDDACHEAGINSDVLPWKSYTRFDLITGKLEYRFGYSARTQSVQLS